MLLPGVLEASCYELVEHPVSQLRREIKCNPVQFVPEMRAVFDFAVRAVTRLVNCECNVYRTGACFHARPHYQRYACPHTC
eukprot:3941729-Rhodomonas_salina.3